MTPRLWRPSALVPALVAAVLVACDGSAALAAETSARTGFVPPVWTVAPFIGMLLSIAVFPLLAAHFWEHHFGKVSAFWMVVALLLMVLSVPADLTFKAAYGPKVFSTYEEYVAFIILLGSLFVISGGILIAGDMPATPAVNTAFLFVGTLLASVIGTTGAAMVLIRPLLRSNAHRRNQVHVVLFFIFLVCNIGGSLTPIGDPPLFLGFLQGVPFFWTLVLTPIWAFSSALVLGGFYVLDRLLAEPAPNAGKLSIRIEGKVNILLLLGVVGAVILSGSLHLEPVIRVGDLGELHLQNLLRDGLMVALAAISLAVTSREIRTQNNFNYGPIREVAYLFIGIFTTMIPALILLNARGAELGIDTPAKYFWATGILSSFLDNAPTYLTFLATAMGALGLEQAVQMTTHPQGVLVLEAISVGAVFMGANTYIGNGPNFMVKAIAEGQGIKMPSFFGYMLYSLIVLIPVFILVTFIFF
ncbi:MAG: sodium:proton antiporter [Candidatus Lambdaproteobacteria bacterium]|nr:sodium:proton antiporter [Candidatus Lambdaproteobacteria bacterium]